MNLYEQIDLAKKFSGKPGQVNESVTGKDMVAEALERNKRLYGAKPEEPKPVQLTALPVSN